MTDLMTNKFAKKYGRSGTCGDDVAKELASYLTDEDTGRLDEVHYQQVADNNSVAVNKWKSLNNGQRRMLLGNVLRGMIRRGGVVRIGDKVFQE